MYFFKLKFGDLVCEDHHYVQLNCDFFVVIYDIEVY